MSKDKKFQPSFRQTTRLPILISAAIAIIALCSLTFYWHQNVQDYKKGEFNTSYNQGMADLGAAFLGHLIEDENTEAIESIGQRLAKNPSIEKIAIYRRSGEQVFLKDSDNTSLSEPVIANIAYEDSFNGYLVIYFADTLNTANSVTAFWLNPYFIWLFGGATWFLIFFVLQLRHRGQKRQLADKRSIEPDDKPPRNHSNGHQLKSLIKHNRQQLQHKTIKQSLVISANWGSLDEPRNALLLRVLSRWLPQNGLLATQFSRGLLVLGVDAEHTPIGRNPLYALERCLLNIQLRPKILLHHLDFEHEMYQTFFRIIESGIWFEKSLQAKDDLNWTVKKVIDIELDDHDVIELCQLKEPDAEQLGLIARQVRFLSDE
ncbi:hypothetical protein [Kangiella marina]|uniref:hypothetical protein n=1 Tax=Kangiella marina TaxID=1079178 RepID=UPI0031F137BB